MAKKIAVIGAGFGGMSAAAYLAQSGHDVTIYEKNRTSSAQDQIVKKKTYTFELNQQWYFMPEVFDDFFRDFDSSAESQYAVQKLPVSYKIFTHETDYAVTAWPDVAELFDALEPGSSERLNKTLHKAEKQYAHVRRDLQEDPVAPKAPGLFHGGDRRPYHEAMAKVLKNHDLQHIMELPVLAMGANPQALPAMYRWLDYVTLGIGLTAPVGGWPAVGAAMQKVAKKAGVTFKYGAEVTKIIVDGHRTVGVEVKGRVEPADVVVAGVDMYWAESQLLEASQRAHHERFWTKRDFAPAQIVACLGIKRKLPELSRHNVLLDMEWQPYLDTVFGAQEWSPKPLLFVDVPSCLNAKLAPKGHETLIIRIPVAAGQEFSDEQLERLLLSIVGRIQEQLGYEFMNDIVVADIKAPDHFATTYKHYQGVGAGLSPDLHQLTKARPSFTHPHVHGLYYIGTYSTPGALPAQLVAAGKTLARQI